MHPHDGTGTAVIAHHEPGQQRSRHHRHGPPVGEPLGEPEARNPHPPGGLLVVPPVERGGELSWALHYRPASQQESACQHYSNAWIWIVPVNDERRVRRACIERGVPCLHDLERSVDELVKGGSCPPGWLRLQPVSYTHLTLPTKRIV